jgi:5-methylcytosine-specific restriction enzyme subunit McrC
MAKTIKVFEHEYLGIGDQDFYLPHWKALARFNARNGNKYFILYPEGIKFNQYVGAIQAGNITIEVLPKSDKGETDKNKWHRVLVKMLSECKFMRVEHPELAHLQLQNNSILEAYFQYFLNEIQKLFHAGLIKRYRKTQGNLLALKGKLLLPQQIRKNIVHHERFYVEYNIYDAQHLIHQILYKALQLISKISGNQIIKANASRILLDFPEMKNVHVKEQTFKRIVKDRKTAPYEQSLLISKMLLLNYRPDITGSGYNVLSILFDMNKLWEEYVYRQIVKLDISLIVHRQNIFDFWKPEKKDGKSIRPDIVIENHPEGRCVIDTKWKMIEDIYPADSDLQQMFAYAHYVDARRLFLLYPGKNKSKVPGEYQKEHFVEELKGKVSCSLLLIPLIWKEGQFQGLDLSKSDFDFIPPQT